MFLDEIGDLDLDLQAKLLRVLQTGQFERVGGNEMLQVDVRLISATNHDLESQVAKQAFREDLLYRLNVVCIRLPPLRQRKDDIPLLAEHIVRRLARKYGWPRMALSADAMKHLLEGSWPGNIRELQNVLARAAIMARGRPILAADLAISTAAAAAARPAESPTATGGAGALSLKEILAETERRAIAQVLEETKWNRTRAALVLGISRRQLFDKIKQYNMEAPG